MSKELIEAQLETSFGGKAVGLKFNPSNDVHVDNVKVKCAELINSLHKCRNETEDGEKKRMYSVAITEIQTAQMWAVKAITWGAN